MDRSCHLQVGSKICVETNDNTTVGPVQSPPGTFKSEKELPVPTVGCESDKWCTEWYLVRPNERTSNVAKKVGLSTYGLIAYNECTFNDAPDYETALWTGYWYCVNYSTDEKPDPS